MSGRRLIWPNSRLEKLGALYTQNVTDFALKGVFQQYQFEVAICCILREGPIFHFGSVDDVKVKVI